MTSWGGEQNAFLDSMAEAGKSVSDHLGGGERIVYISVMNRLSVDCDCDGNPAEPDMHDIGILASTDPVALDQACVDLVYAAPDGQSLVNRMESRNAEQVLIHAEDFAYSGFKSGVLAMGDTDVFTFADRESEGNLSFREREGYAHDGRAANEYMYNALRFFWNRMTPCSSNETPRLWSYFMVN